MKPKGLASGDKMEPMLKPRWGGRIQVVGVWASLSTKQIMQDLEDRWGQANLEKYIKWPGAKILLSIFVR